MGEPPATTPQDDFHVDVRLCHPFIEAVSDTLRTLCALNPTVGKPMFRDPGAKAPRFGVKILAALSSDTLVAMVTMSFPQDLFLKVVSRILGAEVRAVTPEVEEAAKEFSNIVFNRAGRIIAGKKMAVIRSIPAIVFGDGLRTAYYASGRTIVLPLSTEAGNLEIEITGQRLVAQAPILEAA